ncbi:MAG: N-acetylmuramoyl-L-alanine amidase, partial [Gaiellales bacterium]
LLAIGLGVFAAAERLSGGAQPRAGGGSAASIRSASSSGPTQTAPGSSSAPATTTHTAVRPAVPRPRIVHDPIPYGPARRAQMAAYSGRHYGVASWRLHPSIIVLHFTASGAGSYPGVRATFSSDAPSLGEEPGTCAHFVVDQDGTIHQLVPTDVRCRHTIGLNDRAIGIEMIQSAGPSAHWADQQILHRPAQLHSVLALVRWLQARYRIPTRNVIGHAMANRSPYFHDLEGWRNDHTDWQAGDVLELRAKL